MTRLTRPPVSTARRERGFALLIVLWSLVLIALLITQILASGRGSLALAGNLRNAAQARASADGAINEALFHVLANGADHWAADGATHDLDGGGTLVSLRVRSLADKINPNLASTKLLAGLFEATGTEPAQSHALAGSIIQWRSQTTKAYAAAELDAYRRAGLNYGPPGRLFRDVSELGDVIGMTPALLGKISPELSLYQSADPDPAAADETVRRALNLAGQTGAGANVYTGTAPVITIDADATTPGGAVARRLAIISISGNNARTPFRFLSLTDAP